MQPHPGKNPNTRLDVDSAGSPHAQEPRRQGDRRATDSPRVSSLKGTRKLTSGVCCYRKGCCTTCETRTKEGKCIHGHVCVCTRACTCVHYVSRTPICLRINPEMLRPQALLGAQEPGQTSRSQDRVQKSTWHLGSPLGCVRRSALPVWVQILAPLIFNNVSLGQLLNALGLDRLICKMGCFLQGYSERLMDSGVEGRRAEPISLYSGGCGAQGEAVGSAPHGAPCGALPPSAPPSSPAPVSRPLTPARRAGAAMNGAGSSPHPSALSCSPACGPQQPAQPQVHGGNSHWEECHLVLRGLRLLLRAGGPWPAHG